MAPPTDFRYQGEAHRSATEATRYATWSRVFPNHVFGGVGRGCSLMHASMRRSQSVGRDPRIEPQTVEDTAMTNLHEGIRAWAKGIYPTEAAAELDASQRR